MNNNNYTEAVLTLANGDTFHGYSFGAERSVSGEVVFNTGMVGYPESLTDPSYSGEILVLTYPLIGNYGVPSAIREDNLLKHFESDKIQATALVVAEYSEEYSHWNASRSLSDWLKEENIPALFGIDTRRLTRILREHGTMPGTICFHNEDVPFSDPNLTDLVKKVCIPEPVEYNKHGTKRVVLIDCGAKNNIIRNLIGRNVSVLRVPCDYNFLNEQFDGILISNGPGDPKMCTTAIEHIRTILENNVPTFGICLGNQLMALAAGGNTYKLKYGHRSHNQPCTLVGTKRCFITSQNHGYAVDMNSLGEEWKEYFVNANDGTNEGLKHTTKPFVSVQFHPEHTPGPFDTSFLFDEFLTLMK